MRGTTFKVDTKGINEQHHLWHDINSPTKYTTLQIHIIIYICQSMSLTSCPFTGTSSEG